MRDSLSPSLALQETLRTLDILELVERLQESPSLESLSPAKTLKRPAEEAPGKFREKRHYSYHSNSYSITLEQQQQR